VCGVTVESEPSLTASGRRNFQGGCMNVSEPQKKRAPDDKNNSRVLRYWTIVQPLAAAPFILVNRLTSYHWFERLPLALQWSLVILVLVGALFMIWILVLPKWRKQWVRPSRGNWWGGFVVAYSTVIIAFIVTSCFALVSGFLYLQGVATISPERSLA